MGGKQSHLPTSKLYDENDYKQISSINDPRYGEIKVLRYKDSQQLYCVLSRT